MCRPDPALMGFHWEESMRPTLNLRGPEHKCVDWAPYKNELEARSVPVREMNALTKPVENAHGQD